MIPVRVDPNIRPHVVSSGRSLDGHPLQDGLCPVCDGPLVGKVSLVFVGREPDDRGRWTGASVPVHDGCVGYDLTEVDHE